MTVSIVDPCGGVGPTIRAPLARLGTLAGRRIGVLDNGKPNARLLMEELARLVAARTGAEVSTVVAKRTAAEPADPAIIERLAKEADVVLTGSADCGSCTTWSVYDVDRLERSGVLAVGVTTTAFEVVARTMARTVGLPDARLCVVRHPLGGIDDAAVRQSAAAAVEQVISLVTG